MVAADLKSTKPMVREKSDTSFDEAHLKPFSNRSRLQLKLRLFKGQTARGRLLGSFQAGALHAPPKQLVKIPYSCHGTVRKNSFISPVACRQHLP